MKETVLSAKTSGTATKRFEVITWACGQSTNPKFWLVLVVVFKMDCMNFS